jgi:hypothetical protein
MAVTNNVVFVLVDNKQSVEESKEIKALKYDLSQKDIEISNLKNNITTLNNTVSELKSDIKRVIPDLSEFDKFKLTPEYPKFKQEFLEALVRIGKYGKLYIGEDLLYRDDFIKITEKYKKYLKELTIEIELIKILGGGTYISSYDKDKHEPLLNDTLNRVGKKFDIDYIKFAKNIIEYN